MKRVALAMMLASAGCAGVSTSPIALEPSFAQTRSSPVGHYIKHVVIVIQENRSFDNLFHGYPKARSANFGFDHTGKKIPLYPTTLRGHEISHTFANAVGDWDNGKMDGFDLPLLNGYSTVGTYPYAYIKRKAIEPYWIMAQRYVLADKMFPTMFGPSFTAHLDLIAGTANLESDISEADFPVGVPAGCDAPTGTFSFQIDAYRTRSIGPFPCFTQFRTLADTLDAAKVSWKYYAPPLDTGAGKIWTAFDAIKHVRSGPDWKRNVVSPQTRFLTDAANGKLPAVSWVIPDLVDSDHVSNLPQHGPSWVSAVVNSVGKGPDWNSTAIFVVWDDWGGWYDSVPPPQLDFRGLGIRVPCIIISPYAKRGYVSHTQYEFGSILKFVEEAFDLPSLASQAFGSGYTDARANSMDDTFDFARAPRSFQPIPAPLPRSFFLTEKPSLEAPDPY